ncbi:hypothetical protein [Streptomyces subrutilus]|uniref:hypothetical protein n=1 Tax=Streptomyces subrutilus TaxID=36818 RepID=UPI0033E93A40
MRTLRDPTRMVWAPAARVLFFGVIGALVLRGIFLSEEGLVEGSALRVHGARENIVLALQAARGWTRPLPRAKQDGLLGS